MDIQSIYGIENEAERVNTLYAQVFREETRLTWSQAARVEFLTTVRYLEKYLRPGAMLLDVGAGAGEYSLHFARQGYSVDAVELAEANVAAFQKRIEPGMDLRLRRGDARDFSTWCCSWAPSTTWSGRRTGPGPSPRPAGSAKRTG